jgi:hypothetical protein
VDVGERLNAKNSDSSTKVFRLLVVGFFDDSYSWVKGVDADTEQEAQSMTEIEFFDYAVKDVESGKLDAFTVYFPLKATPTEWNGEEHFVVTARARFDFKYKGEFSSLEEAEAQGILAFNERFFVTYTPNPDDLISFPVVNAVKLPL